MEKSSIKDAFFGYNGSTRIDINIDEHSIQVPNSKIPLGEVISSLQKPKNLIFISSKNIKKPVVVFAKEALDSLFLTFKQKEVKKIMIKDVLDVSLAVLLQVHSEADNLHPIQIRSKKKKYTLCFKDLQERNFYYHCLEILLKYTKELLSPSGLKKYCDLQIKNFNNRNILTALNESYAHEHLKITAMQKKIRGCIKETVYQVLSEMIRKLEILETEKKIETLKFQRSEVVFDKKNVEKQKKKIFLSIQHKNEEILFLSDSLDCIKDQISFMKTKFRMSFTCLWRQIIVFLNFEDLFKFSRVSKAMEKVVFSLLRSKTHWDLLLGFDLRPRNTSWGLYINNFFLQEKVWKGTLSKNFKNFLKTEVNKQDSSLEENINQVVLQLSSLFPSEKNCHEMKEVARYLFWVNCDKTQTFQIFRSLLGPPYFLAELWKPEFIRLKLGVFQVQKLLKLKLPCLAKHFKSIQLSLEVIITPWILSVFTCLLNKNIEEETVSTIWDFFIVQGWPALISGCLALLCSSQHQVIGLNLEETLKHFIKPVRFKGISNLMKKFEIEAAFLNELENLFYFSFDEYS